MNKSDLNEQVVEQQEENQKGASLVEYALLVALIAVVCIVAMKTLGNRVSEKFSGIAATVQAS
jgi:Flp pilus assembly pilin Flp